VCARVSSGEVPGRDSVTRGGPSPESRTAVRPRSFPASIPKDLARWEGPQMFSGANRAENPPLRGTGHGYFAPFD